MDQSEPLDLLESKILELERRVYGLKDPPTENFNPVLDSLLTANTLMLSAVNGREKISSAIRRLKELNGLLSSDHIDDNDQIEAKLEVITSLHEQYPEKINQLKSLQQLDTLLDGKHMNDVENLKKDLEVIRADFNVRSEKLKEVSEETRELITQFNTICLEISKTFVALNDSITQLESKKMQRESIEID